MCSCVGKLPTVTTDVYDGKGVSKKYENYVLVEKGVWLWIYEKLNHCEMTKNVQIFETEK